MRVQASRAIAAVAVLASGCAHMSLKEQAVKEIRVLRTENAICPGGETKFSVTAVLGDGQEAVTTGAGHGKVGWKNYVVTFSGGSTDDDKIRMTSDPRVAWNGPATLKVEVVNHPDVVWQGTVPARYNCAQYAAFGGSAGASGSGGDSGSDGGIGERGRSGRDGSTGSSGDPGHSVEAWITTVTGPGGNAFVQAAVESRGDRRFYAFQVLGGSLTIDADGGRGGAGGSGGDGGRGGAASTDAKEGRGGDGATGGCGGDGGDGGDVTLHIDPAARVYRDGIRIRNEGGAGGNGGLYGSGGKGTPKGRDGKSGCTGQSGHDGRVNTIEERVAPLW